MNIHEFQAKEILKSYGVAIQEGIVIDKKEDALAAGKKLREQTGTDWMVVKAQIHAGGRGKGGGVKLAKNMDQLKEHANHNQDKERKMVLRWFTSRLSNRLFSNHYRHLLLELANLMSSSTNRTLCVNCGVVIKINSKGSDSACVLVVSRLYLFSTLRQQG